jgi:DNA-binding GntR family transcriptional regulator
VIENEAAPFTTEPPNGAGTLRRAREVGSLTDLAYEELLEAILDQRVPAGTRLVPETIASQLGVSATPVKLALARLVSEGLVAEVARRGMFVTELTPNELEALFDARMLLEAAAARDYTHQVTPEFLEGLAGLADAHRAAIGAADPHSSREISDTDRRFHRAIVELTGNEHVVRWYETTNIHIHANRSADPRRRRTTLLEHDAIVEAFRSRDARQTEDAIRAHIDNAKRFAVATLRARASWPAFRQIGAQRRQRGSL